MSKANISNINENATLYIYYSKTGHISPRKEILHNIDPLTPAVGERLYEDTFDNRVRAAIRVGEWKLITGNPSESSVHSFNQYPLKM